MSESILSRLNNITTLAENGEISDLLENCSVEDLAQFTKKIDPRMTEKLANSALKFQSLHHFISKLNAYK